MRAGQVMLTEEQEDRVTHAAKRMLRDRMELFIENAVEDAIEQTKDVYAAAMACPATSSDEAAEEFIVEFNDILADCFATAVGDEREDLDASVVGPQ